MAVSFTTNNPSQLLKDFDARINQREEKGKITTWQKDGNDYTHAASQWHKKAWFRPSIEQGRLTFNIIKPQGQNISVPVYGYYHGHLIETFLNHFDAQFSGALSTSQCVSGDICSAA